MKTYILVLSAVLPVLFLCLYIHKKDVNKEPKRLLVKLFTLGFFSAIPIVIIELLLTTFFDAEKYHSFIQIFLATFFGVGLIEEGFKWLIVKKVGYKSKDYDDIYDIIVYSVFVSLGFACIENILYVISNGLANAILRALISIPGHMCFAVIMGYYLSKSKINELNKNYSLSHKNMILSLLIPSLVHTIYDTLIVYFVANQFLIIIPIFIIFDISMVIICFKTVNKVSKAQQNINLYIIDNNSTSNCNPDIQVNFCPICGNSVKNYNYCKNCGYKLR